MNPASIKIAIIGNCQGGHLSRLLSALSKDQYAIVCRHIIAYDAAAPGDREFIESADRILVQAYDFQQHNDAIGALGGARGKKIAYPLLAGHFLYPFGGKAHPRNAESKTAHFPLGHYDEQVSDSRLISLMAANPREDPEALAHRFLAENFADFVDLDRFFEMNKHKMERIGNAVGLNLWPIIERSFRDQPIFWTYGHPSEALLGRLHHFMLESLDIGLSAAQIRSAIESVTGLQDDSVHTPIHPSVAVHFGITWTSPSYKYSYFLDGRFDIHAFFTRYIRFEYADELYRALFDIGNKRNLDEVIQSLVAIRQRLPENPHVHLLLSQAYYSKQLLHDALNSAVSAASLAPTRRDIVTYLCNLMRQTRAVAPGPLMCSVGRSYSFSSANLEMRAALKYGWSHPEEWGVWSESCVACLEFRVSGLTRKLNLRFELSAFVPKEDESLTVDIVVNGKKHSTWRFRHTSGEIRKWLRNITPILAAGELYVNILFRTTNPNSPASFGMNGDTRELGLGLRAMTLEEAAQQV